MRSIYDFRMPFYLFCRFKAEGSDTVQNENHSQIIPCSRSDFFVENVDLDGTILYVVHLRISQLKFIGRHTGETTVKGKKINCVSKQHDLVNSSCA